MKKVAYDAEEEISESDEEDCVKTAAKKLHIFAPVEITATAIFGESNLRTCCKENQTFVHFELQLNANL